MKDNGFSVSKLGFSLIYPPANILILSSFLDSNSFQLDLTKWVNILLVDGDCILIKISWKFCDLLLWIRKKFKNKNYQIFFFLMVRMIPYNFLIIYLFKKLKKILSYSKFIYSWFVSSSSSFFPFLPCPILFSLFFKNSKSKIRKIKRKWIQKKENIKNWIWKCKNNTVHFIFTLYLIKVATKFLSFIFFSHLFSFSSHFISSHHFPVV